MINQYNILLVFLFCVFPFLYSQEKDIECFPQQITDKRDFPKNIPGKTMGQKLESLLFWSQEEKERRFALMHSIYPSLPVAIGKKVKPLMKTEVITPLWENDYKLSSYIEDNKIGGVIVLHNNKIKLEAYGKMANENTLWTSYSVAKSISSMLVGAALKDRSIQSMDDELQKYIVELKGKEYGKVTVRELLTMTSGIQWNEDYADPNSDVALMYQNDCEGEEAHILTYMKNLKQIHSAGERWNYSTGETDLIGILIQRATGKSLSKYLSEKFWQPFGMEHCGFWLTDECSNMNIGGSGLSASIRDYARLGLVMLQEGKIDGDSIFDLKWLENATSILYPTDERGGGYGYLWWCNPDGSYAAQGIFGQMIYINPSKHLVIAQVAAWTEASSKELSKNRQEFIDAVIRSL